MNVGETLFGTAGLLPLGACLAWQPSLIWMRAIADAATGLAYVSVPLALVYLGTRRGDLVSGWLVGLFAAFTVAAALGCVLDVGAIWYPIHGLEGAIRVVAAIAAGSLAAALWPLVPRIVALPSRAQLAGVLGELSQETGKRVEAVAGLRASEERYRLLVENVIDYAIYMLDPQGVVTNWNRGAQRIKGYRADEIVGRHFSVFYTPEDREAGMPQRALEIAVREGKFETEALRVRKDGSRFWASVVIDPIRDADGQLLGYAKVTRDITERIDAQAALRESEQRFRLLVTGVVDYALFMLDANGMVTNWNPGAERIKGYRADEIVGRHFSVFYTPEDREAGVPQRALEIARREGRFEAEAPRVRKDGSRFWANVVIDALRDDDGRIIGFAKITRDVTERVVTARALEETRETLAQAQKMEAVGQLTGGIAHDFNNLLTAILGSMSLALDDAVPVPPELRPLLLTSVRACERGAELTRSLLAFSRRQVLSPAVTDLNKLIGSMSELLQRTLGGPIDVQTVLAGGLWRPNVDPNQLENAVLNLALNARDAMPDGGKLTIETANVYLDEEYEALHDDVPAGQYVLIAVSDTGTGIPKETLARIFEPFFTTKPMGRGSGLGLSQVFGFVKQSGGHLKAYSEPGTGTTMKIYLPRHIGSVPEPEPIRPRAALPQGQGEVVLVVEDDPDVRQFTVQALQLYGFRPIEAETPAAALRAIESDPEIKLMFTDVMMPGMNGRVLSDRARAFRPDLKVLFMTGYARNAIVHHGVLDAGVELLPKPFTPAALVRKIREMLGA